MTTKTTLPSDLVRRGWCQEVPARDAYGEPVDRNGSSASAWCLFGALTAAHLDKEIAYYDAVRHALADRGHLAPVSDWNDDPERTQSEVVELLESVERRLGLRTE